MARNASVFKAFSVFVLAKSCCETQKITQKEPSLLCPRPFCVPDISEFALNKLRDRGSLEVTTIVSNIQDFLFKIVSLLAK
jgi:hypothetical protein